MEIFVSMAFDDATEKVVSHPSSSLKSCYKATKRPLGLFTLWHKIHVIRETSCYLYNYRIGGALLSQKSSLRLLHSQREKEHYIEKKVIHTVKKLIDRLVCGHQE